MTRNYLLATCMASCMALLSTLSNADNEIVNIVGKSRAAGATENPGRGNPGTEVPGLGREKVRVIARVRDENLGRPGFKPNPQKFANARSELQTRGIGVQRAFPSLGYFVFEVSRPALAGLSNSRVFDRVEVDVPHPPSLLQSTAQIGADMVHGEGYSGAGYAVAILDSGVEVSHPFYASRLVEEACFSSNTSTSTSLCPNGQTTQTGSGAANDCSPAGIRGCDHGTHVAGIAAGSGSSFSGVATGSDIVAVQVFSAFPATHPSCGGSRCILSYASDQLAALQWVLNDSTTNDIAAVNVSIGGGSSESACDSDVRANIISDLRSAGIATVISSGNDGESEAVGFPGCISTAITVGSVRTNDSIDTFSNSSSLVDVLAPGSGIQSSVVGGGFQFKSGTSMAAPHVTGAIAVLREVYPDATVDEIEFAMESTGVQSLDPRNNLTFPRLDIPSAKVLLQGPIASFDQSGYSAVLGETYEFTAHFSSNPNGNSLSYTWNFGDGSTEVTTTAPVVYHAYSGLGSYELKLTVSDGDRQSKASKSNVTVYDPAVVSAAIMR